MTKIDIRKHLVPLELLDIKKCTTVGKTVEQMEKCAIGARMIGEAAATMMGWINSGKDPMVIYDDLDPKEKTFNLAVENFAKNLQEVQCGHRTLTVDEYVSNRFKNPIIVLGHYPKKWQNWLYGRGPDEVIFINDINRPPSWVRDGFFKGFVNADPRLILPILFRVQEERTGASMGRSALGLIDDWSKAGGVAHQAAHGFETFLQMIEDPDCVVFATMSGILTMAKLGGLVSYMIDQDWVQAISATGALIGHGFVEGVGLKHFKYDPKFDDEQLAEQKLNRIGTTLEPEENLDGVEEILSYVLGEKLALGGIVSPSKINFLIGKYLAEKYPNEVSILRSAYKKNIPVFLPASPDSELGNDILIHNWRRREQNLPEVVVNQEIDGLRLVEIMTSAKKLGIFTLGGGTPRNYIQNGAPLVEIMNVRLGLGLRENKYFYGCRICPDEVFLEHLSGCTYKENGSWRKTDIKHGRFSEVIADYSLVFPFYVAAMRELQEGK